MNLLSSKEVRVRQILDLLGSELSNNKVSLPSKFFTEKFPTVRYPYKIVKGKLYSDFGIFLEEFVAFELSKVYKEKYFGEKIKMFNIDRFGFPNKDVDKYIHSIDQIVNYLKEKYSPENIQKIVHTQEWSFPISSECTLMGHPDFVFYLNSGEVVIFDVKVFSLMNKSKNRDIRMQIACYIYLAKCNGLKCRTVGVIMPWSREENPVREYDVQKWYNQLSNGEFSNCVATASLSSQQAPLIFLKWFALLNTYNVGSHIKKEDALMLLNLPRREKYSPFQIFLYGNNPSPQNEQKEREELFRMVNCISKSVYTGILIPQKELSFFQNIRESNSEIISNLKYIIEQLYKVEICGMDTKTRFEVSSDCDTYVVVVKGRKKFTFKNNGVDTFSCTLREGDHLFIPREFVGRYEKIVQSTNKKGKECEMFVFYSKSENNFDLRSDFKGLDAFVHAPYNLNLAKSDKYIHKSMRMYMKDAKDLCFKGVVFHVGHKQSDINKRSEATNATDEQNELQDDNEERGLQNMKCNIEKVLEIIDSKTPLLLETPCGSKNELLETPEKFCSFISQFPTDRVKLCFDTCHVFVSGFNPSSYLKTIDEYGLQVGLIHFNGSRKRMGCGCDGHKPVNTPQNIPDDELIYVLEYAKNRNIKCVQE
jgi:endonuclease IV